MKKVRSIKGVDTRCSCLCSWALVVVMKGDNTPSASSHNLIRQKLAALCMTSSLRRTRTSPVTSRQWSYVKEPPPRSCETETLWTRGRRETYSNKDIRNNSNEKVQGCGRKIGSQESTSDAPWKDREARGVHFPPSPEHEEDPEKMTDGDSQISRLDRVEIRDCLMMSTSPPPTLCFPPAACYKGSVGSAAWNKVMF
ncbi:unnamed protein product [Pleuronectes platessa]|uniref:Uncharacterized protein n=1 Tax=Pleuronectes platessa TaxID=8262 RepID=A0A9N7VV62_PLEPL|nr:unnamed protein product [Pleuronectes platessa]